MGQRSKTETVVAILQAFVRRRSWGQPELARAVEVGVPALRKHLVELSASGFPLTRDDDDPSHVVWRVPKNWFPGAVLFDSESVPELLRQLSRLPRSAARDRLIGRILEAAPRPSIAPPAPSAVLTPEPSQSEEMYLSFAEDSAGDKVCLRFHYFTASRGDLAWRYASVQRVAPGPPARFVAVCHRDGSLKWFRLDNVMGAHLDRSEPYRTADAGQLTAMVRESVDGFHSGEAVQCSFFVREPESRWVKRNLPSPMTAEVVPGGLLATGTTAGVLRLARYVVGLGVAARAETPALAMLVTELAEGALKGSGTIPARPGHAAERPEAPAPSMTGDAPPD